jgi:hypothetical protein
VFGVYESGGCFIEPNEISALHRFFGLSNVRTEKSTPTLSQSKWLAAKELSRAPPSSLPEGLASGAKF